ncbi:MAG: PD-(D/E)XK nuclease family protein, partial [Alphaproteobacteria bacterium]
TQNLIWIKQLPFWIAAPKEAPAQLNDYFEKQEELASEEKHRLLYVALTRASDRLYICGYNGSRSAPVDNWYDLIKESLGEEEITRPIVFTSKQKKEIKPKEKTNLVPDFENIPEWVLTLPPNPPLKPLPLSPSKMGEEEVAKSEVHQERELSLKRGSFIHEMLQYLPDIPKEKRPETLEKLRPSEIEMPPHFLDIFERFSDIFGPSSLAEVPVIGLVKGQALSGQIDRLIVNEKEVIVVDFKTNRFVPQTVPSKYQKQLEAYKDLLKDIFPDKIIKSYLLWTETMTLVEV